MTKLINILRFTSEQTDVGMVIMINADLEKKYAKELLLALYEIQSKMNSE